VKNEEWKVKNAHPASILFLSVFYSLYLLSINLYSYLLISLLSEKRSVKSQGKAQ